MVGGHYTYAEVPLFNWLRDTFGLSRNHYDRVGHFAQGFIPAILTREILIRRTPLRPGKWLTFLSVAVCLAFSAFYELVEWWTAMATGEAATAFLGHPRRPVGHAVGYVSGADRRLHLFDSAQSGSRSGASITPPVASFPIPGPGLRPPYVDSWQPPQDRLLRKSEVFAELRFASEESS